MYKKIMDGEYDEKKKKEFRNWSLKSELSIARMSIGAVASPWPAICLAAFGILPDITGPSWPIFWGFTAMNIPSVLYPVYLRNRYSKFIEGYDSESKAKEIKKGAKLVLSSIPSASMSATPWIWGGIKNALGKGDKNWIKTPRTKSSDESLKDIRPSQYTFNEMLSSKDMSEEYALRQLATYFHDDPEKSKIYKGSLDKVLKDGCKK